MRCLGKHDGLFACRWRCVSLIVVVFPAACQSFWTCMRRIQRRSCTTSALGVRSPTSPQKSLLVSSTPLLAPRASTSKFTWEPRFSVWSWRTQTTPWQVCRPCCQHNPWHLLVLQPAMPVHVQNHGQNEAWKEILNVASRGVAFTAFSNFYVCPPIFFIWEIIITSWFRFASHGAKKNIVARQLDNF